MKIIGGKEPWWSNVKNYFKHRISNTHYNHILPLLHSFCMGTNHFETSLQIVLHEAHQFIAKIFRLMAKNKTQNEVAS
jgi:hypothetical protein